MSAIWANAQPIVVTTLGPGNLNLFSYQSNSNGVNIIGHATTANAGITRFLVSFSHSYLKYAFYWDGQGEAMYATATWLERLPVGTSWKQASALSFNNQVISTLDVSQLVAGAFNVGNTTTCYIIPDEN